MARPPTTDRVNDDDHLGLSRDVPRRHLAGWRGYVEYASDYSKELTTDTVKVTHQRSRRIERD